MYEGTLLTSFPDCSLLAKKKKNVCRMNPRRKTINKRVKLNVVIKALFCRNNTIITSAKMKQ
jgi:hypothetical protein